jgi:hypothetical protein
MAEFWHLLVLAATYAFFYLDCVTRPASRENQKRDLIGFLHQGQGLFEMSMASSLYHPSDHLSIGLCLISVMDDPYNLVMAKLSPFINIIFMACCWYFGEVVKVMSKIGHAFGKGDA